MHLSLRRCSIKSGDQGAILILKKKKRKSTRRELEVLHGLVLGLKDREIGETLYISEFTVRAHIKSIYRKLNVSSRAKAVIMAREQGIIGD